MRARRLVIAVAALAAILALSALSFRYASRTDPSLETGKAEEMLRDIFQQTPAREDIRRGRDWLRLDAIWHRFEPRLAVTMTAYWWRGPRVPLCGKWPFRYATMPGLSNVRYVTMRTSPVSAQVRIDFKHYGQTDSVTYDLVATRLGWRIRDIAWHSGIWISGYPPEMSARGFLSVFAWKWPLLECDVA